MFCSRCIFEGRVKEHDVYPRSHLQALHTAQRWIRDERREVLPGSVAVKSVKANHLASNQEDSQLFGIWQTQPWTPPTAVGGIVPRSSLGNVDLWTPAHLPLGCTHLPYHRVQAAAKALKVDFAMVRASCSKLTFCTLVDPDSQ